jgi:surfactin synthase thioesterase subunit
VTQRTRNGLTEEEARPVSVPFWREAFTGLDWARLRLSPILYGIGAPRGDRSAVVTVPGFLGSDLYHAEFRAWLRLIGYRAFPSRIGRNWDCLQISGEKLTKTVEEAYRQTGKPVHLIGHSLGGLLARSVASIIPEKIASVTTLGSPINAINAHSLVLSASDVVRESIRFRGGSPEIKDEHCFTGKCTCEVVRCAREPKLDHIPVMAIYTKTDGVVYWESCLDEEADINHEVRGTHCGLAFNADVFRKVSLFLKECQTEESPVMAHRVQMVHTQATPETA